MFHVSHSYEGSESYEPQTHRDVFVQLYVSMSVCLSV